jgi:molybdopterin-guanine dinucleotide biosynthesis protein A
MIPAVAITGLILAGGRGSRMGHIDKGLQAFKGLPLWPDLLPEFPGPLAGLQAGLSRCATPYLLSVPCDSPLLPLDLAARLSQGLQDAGADLALASTDGEQPGRRQRHPVFCLMKTSVLPQLDAFLREGGRKMETWMAALASVDVHFEDAAAFSNINTLQQLQQLEQPSP